MRKDVLLAALVSSLVSAVLTLGFGVILLPRVAAQNGGPDLIILRDQDGIERARFGVAENGAVGLFLVDRSGAPRAMLALNQEDVPILALTTPGGPSVDLRVTNNGTTMEFKQRQDMVLARLQSEVATNGAVRNGITFSDPQTIQCFAAGRFLEWT